MKRSKPLRRTPFLSKKKPMKQVSAKKAAYRRSNAGQEAMEYMRKVKQLPCAVTGAPPPSDAHHCICGRFGTRKSSDFDVIPLAPEMHRHPYPNAIHTSKKAWVEKYGNDYDYIAETREKVRQLDQ